MSQGTCPRDSVKLLQITTPLLCGGVFCAIGKAEKLKENRQMVLNTGNRTDIPAFYSEWFARRLQEGYVLSRNPYNPEQVIRYELDPDVVDIIMFCTKNPGPMLKYMDLLRPFTQYWHVTITPYGKEIEPGVPDKKQVIRDFIRLSEQIGPDHICWRYDPVFIDETYTAEHHLRVFDRMAGMMEHATKQVIISFIDLYEKTKRNFPKAREVTAEEQNLLGEKMAEIAESHGMRIKACLENPSLSRFGIDVSGCFTRQDLERVLGEELEVPGTAMTRKGCSCVLGSDIGAYNTCAHFCRYCYANYDRETVLANRRLHDPESPLLVGHLMPQDKVRSANQVSWKTGQLTLNL